MLTITIEGKELYDEATQRFIICEPIVVTFEHSLVSLSKWESKFGKVFLLDEERTQDEIKGYFEAMVVSDNFTPEIFAQMSQADYDKISDYIKSAQSATTFTELGAKQNRMSEVTTSEMIYYWMVAANIPPEYEVWHLNRLFNLIRIYGIKNSKDKKMSPRDAAAHQRNLNEQRKKEMGTTG